MKKYNSNKKKAAKRHSVVKGKSVAKFPKKDRICNCRYLKRNDNKLGGHLGGAGEKLEE